MSDPIVFDATSPRLALPLLYSGQAQKEFYVNEAFAIIDALLHGSVEGTSPAPPETPIDGTGWIVGAGATGEWSGRDGTIACQQSGQWLYVSPRDGMRLLDRSTGQQVHYLNGWQRVESPAEPSGGSNVDTEARQAIVELMAALKGAGIFAQD
ncbi:hypothetical protein GCM10011371_26960 [Novosphingobium marinum]|uniref:DUF2793 domain-containing protein n=1 Tax=Novosphingobium marinum TaxID=1514948 RepID=A0A7Y9XWP2_9SPHN|nr:DUF2793 domain-containing protein [Novosphingobium marinum]NYH94688.1 hypothetical protein [Novosphingobium marinum]GGC38158.1 hypothetical protein GCM10011371_26960 [Novosphingobium marinum]